MPQSKEERKKYLDEYYKRPEAIARRRERNKKYNKTAKGISRRKKYNNSPRGIELNKKHKRKQSLSKYKIKEEKYYEILKNQTGLCAICKSDSPRRKSSKNFTIDHSHTTGEVRGLLCHPCNVLLGMANDNIETLKSAIDYLEKYK